MATTHDQLMAKLEMMHGDILETLVYTTRNTRQIHLLGVQMTALDDKIQAVSDALDAFSDRENREDANAQLAADLSRSTIDALNATIEELRAGAVTPENLAALEQISSTLETLNAEAPPTPEEPTEPTEPEPEPAPEEPTP